MGRFASGIVLSAVAACYAPHPPAGAPCSTGGDCPDGLVCSPATNTCELTATEPSDGSATDAHDRDAPVLLDQTWVAAGNLGTARHSYNFVNLTATRLPNSKALVVGGYTGSALLASCELYDPTTGAWTTTEAMATPRVWHSATLLQSGKVLVAGGKNGLSNQGSLATAELYDPATAMWTATAPMHSGRANHTATLLASGMVLVVGASTPNAELYDPIAGTWTVITPPKFSHLAHTATLLQNGKVLVVGDGGFTLNTSSAELYDPIAGTWTQTGSITPARYDHTATLLPDGRVLVASGYDPNIANNVVTANLYDPATGMWSATNPMAGGRARANAVLLPNGKVLVVGGYKTGVGYLTTAELYDPTAGTWAPTVNALTTARADFTLTLLANGKVIAAGGQNSTGALASTESYQ